MENIIGIIIFSYLLGSIPFGLILTKIFTKQDIRTIGSGNIGATNVLRTGNKLLAIATLILDSGKGAVAVFIAASYHGVAYHYFPDDAPFSQTFIALTAALGAIIGHCFPIWLKFKGGKGVATTAGVLLVATPWTGLIALSTWLISAFSFRISSLAALIATVVAPIATFFIYGFTPAIITLMIALLILWRHKDNIRRLIKGDEPKIGQKKKDAS